MESTTAGETTKTIETISTTVGEVAKSMSQAGRSSTNSYIVTNSSLTPLSEGNSTISIVIKSAYADVKTEKSARVKKTNPLSIAYFPVQGPFNCPSTRLGAGCFDPKDDEDPWNFSAKATDFVSATFPIAGHEVTGTVGTPLEASWRPELTDVPSLGEEFVKRDLERIAFEKTLLGYSQHSFIGVVPRGYFDYNGLLNVRGYSLVDPGPHFNTSLVQEGWWTTVAHEIAHTFGAKHETISKAYGFWTSLNKVVENSKNIMLDDGGTIGGSLDGQWITSSTFETIFQNNLTTPSDPELLVVAGFIHRDGSVEFFSSGYLPQGFESGNSSVDDSRIQLKDRHGNLLSSASFNASYSVELLSLTGGAQYMNSDLAPFLVKLPFESSASILEVESHGQLLAVTYPTSNLIIDTIQAIDPHSFKRHPEQVRQRILDQIRQVEAHIKSCANSSSDKTSSEKI